MIRSSCALACFASVARYLASSAFRLRSCSAAAPARSSSFDERIWEGAYWLSGSIDSWSVNDLSEMWGAVWDAVREEIWD
jgi:hypothetical protein